MGCRGEADAHLGLAPVADDGGLEVVESQRPGERLVGLGDAYIVFVGLVVIQKLVLKVKEIDGYITGENLGLIDWEGGGEKRNPEVGEEGGSRTRTWSLSLDTCKPNACIDVSNFVGKTTEDLRVGILAGEGASILTPRAT